MHKLLASLNLTYEIHCRGAMSQNRQLVVLLSMLLALGIGAQDGVGLGRAGRGGGSGDVLVSAVRSDDGSYDNAPSNTATWQSWLENFGHDTYQYPEWITQQAENCDCAHVGGGEHVCRERDSSSNSEEWATVDVAAATSMSYCTARAWLLSHMPEFDKHFLPPSVAVRGASMFEDNIAFTLMAIRAAPWATKLPVALQHAYLLPYGSFHEARVNWRPLLFAKFRAIIDDKNNLKGGGGNGGIVTTRDAMAALVAPNTFTNWTGYPAVEGAGGRKAASSSSNNYKVHWLSSTTPPVLSPFDFLAYGYGSCSGWATFIVYQARALGIAARQAGTPCWNSGQFAGRARDNPNVTLCWHGGNGTNVGSSFLNNHNWVEFWDTESRTWEYINVPPGSKTPNAGLCSFNASTGCDYDPVSGCSKITGGPGAAMEDHPIVSVTWNKANELPHELEGGSIIEVGSLTLTSGEPVSTLVWSPGLKSPAGDDLRSSLRVVNRTDTYRCHAPTSN